MYKNTKDEIEREAVFGVVPVLNRERLYNFTDAALVLSGYCIATWSYTQGSYLATLVGFKQLLIGAFAGAVLMLIIYQLPVILSVRYGIDIWFWLKAVLGYRGVTLMTVIIIIINFPWYAVCADLFANSMGNLLELFGFSPPFFLTLALRIGCVVIGTLIAYRGVGAITKSTKILVPLLLILGLMVIIIGFTSVPFSVVWDYKPKMSLYRNNIIPYIISIEANFAFVITLVGGMGSVPRLARTERGGYFAGVVGQGVSGSLFVVAGAVMAISMEHITGKMIDDPTLMLATLTVPALASASLLLVAFANIGTQAVGSYIYGVMLKSSFRKADYNILIFLLAVYASALCVWGKIVEYFGSFLTISACIYAPLAAVLFTDFFFVRKQKISLRDAFRVEGHNMYNYTKGFNLVGLVSIVLGVIMSLAVYNPVTSKIHNMLLFRLTPTGFSFIGTCLVYYFLCCLPFLKGYALPEKN